MLSLKGHGEPPTGSQRCRELYWVIPSFVPRVSDVFEESIFRNGVLFPAFSAPLKLNYSGDPGTKYFSGPKGSLKFRGVSKKIHSFLLLLLGARGKTSMV